MMMSLEARLTFTDFFKGMGPKPLTFNVADPVLAACARKKTVIPSVYAAGAGSKLTWYWLAFPEERAY